MDLLPILCKVKVLGRETLFPLCGILDAEDRFTDVQWLALGAQIEEGINAAMRAALCGIQVTNNLWLGTHLLKKNQNKQKRSDSRA